jgi:hypothetical protein
LKPALAFLGVLLVAAMVYACGESKPPMTPDNPEANANALLDAGDAPPAPAPSAVP